jgi:ribosomal subunit interface protein
MQTNIKYTDMEHSDELRDYVDVKIGGAIEKMLHKDELETVVCDVELQRTTNAQNGDVYRAEATLEVSGTVYRVENTEPDMKKAIDKVKDDLTQALRKRKQQKRHSFLKGAQFVKKMLRGE